MTAAIGKGRGPAQREPSPLTTATLTSLLPRRRRKIRNDPWEVDSEGEIDTSGLGDEDDELASANPRRGRPRKESRPLGSSENTTAQATKLRPRKPARRTYGSRNFSDKENQEGEGDSIEVAVTPLPDDTFDGPDGSEDTTFDLAEELKIAAKKFKEVDKWELDFEEVTQSSSPKDAR